MTGRTNINIPPSYSIERALPEDFRKIVSLYKAVRNQLNKDEKVFVYPPSIDTLDRISRGIGHIIAIRHKSLMDVVGAMVIEYPFAANDNFGLSRRLVSDFEKCSVLRSYVTSNRHRNIGLGKFLVSEWVKQSLADGRPYCVTEVVQRNNISFNIFLGSGFRGLKRAVHPFDSARTHLLALNAAQYGSPVPNIFR